MAREAVWVCVALCGALLLGTAAAMEEGKAEPGDGRARKVQEYIADDFVLTAEDIYTALYEDAGLYDVKMWYDVEFQDAVLAGESVPWTPPFAYYYDFGYWRQYVRPSSCLGVLGPLGPVGVLSDRGPLYVNQSYQAWPNVSDSCTWCGSLLEWMRQYYALSPFGEDGPLGEFGPLTTEEVYNDMYTLNQLFGANDFPVNLDITGVWGVLGPLSVLGALGPLGPLGPVSLHSVFDISPDGDYLQNGTIVRDLPVQFNKTTYRVYRLVEDYDADYARALGSKNDCSFYLDSSLSATASHNQFEMASDAAQVVTAVVVPGLPYSAPLSTAFGDFGVRVERLSGGAWAEVGSSNTNTSTHLPPTVSSRDLTGYVDFVILRALPGDVLRVTVLGGKSAVGMPYRLVVVGSGFMEGPKGEEQDADLFNHANIVMPWSSFAPSTR